MAAEGLKEATRKRAPKNETTSQLLKKLAEGSAELARIAERATQSLRVHNHRSDRKQEAVMAILQQHFDIRGQVKRGWLMISENDQETLRNFGFQEPRRDRS